MQGGEEFLPEYSTELLCIGHGGMFDKVLGQAIWLPADV
jgi:hypothetical protein